MIHMAAGRSPDRNNYAASTSWPLGRSTSGSWLWGPVYRALCARCSIHRLLPTYYQISHSPLHLSFPSPQDKTRKQQASAAHIDPAAYGSSQHGRGSAEVDVFPGRHQEEHSEDAASGADLEVVAPHGRLDGRDLGGRLCDLRRRHPHPQRPDLDDPRRSRGPRLLLGLERRVGVPVAQRAPGCRRRGGAAAPAPPCAKPMVTRLGRHRLCRRGAVHERQGGPQLRRHQSGSYRLQHPGRRGQRPRHRGRAVRPHLPPLRWTGVLTTTVSDASI